MVASDAVGMFKEEARARMLGGVHPLASDGARVPAGQADAGKATAKAAKLTGVSSTSVERALHVKASGDDDLIAKVRSGEVSVAAAAKMVKDRAAPPAAKSEPKPRAKTKSAISPALDIIRRMRECERAGVTPRTEIWKGADPIAFVLSVNLHRRHLTESQRAMVAARVANLGHGGDRSKRPIDPLTKSVDQAAESLSVSEKSVKRARSLIEHGAPELVAAVERGEVKVSAAAEVAHLPKAEQAKIVSEGRVKVSFQRGATHAHVRV